jgi:sigma-B regulation protein RsbU (phosphoserine phosphatase)
MLYRDGRVELLAGIHGPMLGFGLSQESEYGEDTFNLCQGDRLLFFTDGLTEARKGPDPQKDMLGMEGLQGIYQDICRNQAGQVLDTVFLAVDGFRRGYEAKDDATGLLLLVN